MKLLVFSDIHNDRQALERLVAMDADYYIGAGDLVSWARGLDAMAAILKPRGERVWLLPGNHESDNDIASLCGRFGFRAFHGRSEPIGGVNVAGLGYSSPTPFNTPGEYTEQQIAAKLQAFDSLQPLVLICHAPPKSTPLDCIRPGVHAGSESVRRFIEQHQPRYFFCGHVHEAEGVEVSLGATRAVNVGKKGFLLDLALVTA